MHSASIHSKKDRQEQEYLAGWQRATADLDNLKKRLSQERASQQQSVKREVFSSLLSLADNFQALANHIPDDLSENPWAQGVAHIARQFDQILSEHGVTVIQANDTEFDPNFHEAIEQIKNTKNKSGYVVEVVQTGYKIDQDVIRPAKVKVAA